jgi:hypothetical protein
MKSITIILLIILLSIDAYCQKGIFKPFKLIVISPDTAVIDPSLIGFEDSVEQSHLRAYYNSINQMEEMLVFTDYPDDMKKQFEENKKLTKANLDSARKYENEVKKFKYFQVISEYSVSVFQFSFNEYPPFSTFQLIKSCPSNIGSIKQLADSLQADYIVGYKNIHTEKNNGDLILRLTTFVYSKKEDKIILEKETTGDLNSHGDMWTCDNPLNCLLINGVRSSTENVSGLIYGRQKK